MDLSQVPSRCVAGGCGLALSKKQRETYAYKRGRASRGPFCSVECNRYDLRHPEKRRTL